MWAVLTVSLTELILNKLERPPHLPSTLIPSLHSRTSAASADAVHVALPKNYSAIQMAPFFLLQACPDTWSKIMCLCTLTHDCAIMFMCVHSNWKVSHWHRNLLYSCICMYSCIPWYFRFHSEGCSMPVGSHCTAYKTKHAFNYALCLNYLH